MIIGASINDILNLNLRTEYGVLINQSFFVHIFTHTHTHTYIYIHPYLLIKILYWCERRFAIIYGDIYSFKSWISSIELK